MGASTAGPAQGGGGDIEKLGFWNSFTFGWMNK